MNKVIIHSDLNSCYANIACQQNPKIRRFPVAVCGDKELRHGIVMAANILAKEYGIGAGQTIGDAQQKCPGLIIVPPDMDTVEIYSEGAFNIYSDYADNIEKIGKDEVWAEITNIARDERDGRQVADEIRAKIKEQLGITASVGVSFCKIFSKLASDIKKPDASTVISREYYKDIVWRLPADSLLGVNRGTMRIFDVMKIKTIGDLANTSVELLEHMFGKVGRYLHNYANGENNSLVKHKDYIEPPKTIGKIETTYRDMVNMDDVKRVAYMLSDNVASLLREQGYKCRTVQVYIREYDLKSCERQATFERPTFMAKDIAEKALDIFRTRYKFTKPLRSLGVRACGLVPENISIQTSLFDDIEQNEKIESLEFILDRIRSMYGFDIVQRGIVCEDRKLTYIPPDYNRSPYRKNNYYA